MKIIYGILVIKSFGDLANPYFAFVLVSIFSNLMNFPLFLVYMKLSRNLLEQFILIFRLSVILLLVQTLITIFTLIFPTVAFFIREKGSMQGLIFLLCNEGFRLVQSLILGFSFAYIKRNQFVFERLSE